MSSSQNGVIFLLLLLLLFLLSASFDLQNRQVFASPVKEQSFERLDPLRRLKHYDGAYDVRNKHYWAVSSISLPNLALILYHTNLYILFATKFSNVKKKKKNHPLLPGVTPQAWTP